MNTKETCKSNWEYFKGVFDKIYTLTANLYEERNFLYEEAPKFFYCLSLLTPTAAEKQELGIWHGQFLAAIEHTEAVLNSLKAADKLTSVMISYCPPEEEEGETND